MTILGIGTFNIGAYGCNYCKLSKGYLVQLDTRNRCGVTADTELLYLQER